MKTVYCNENVTCQKSYFTNTYYAYTCNYVYQYCIHVKMNLEFDQSPTTIIWIFLYEAQVISFRTSLVAYFLRISNCLIYRRHNSVDHGVWEEPRRWWRYDDRESTLTPLSVAVPVHCHHRAFRKRCQDADHEKRSTERGVPSPVKLCRRSEILSFIYEPCHA